jgi:hypothetical protein
MLQVGAGTGLLFILRWFWWRVNAVSEIVAMVVSFIVAVTLKLGDFGLASWQELLTGVGITTVCWVSAALLTPAADSETLDSFCRKINPGGPGWRGVYLRLAAQGSTPEGLGVNIPRGILCMLLGCAAVYGVLFGTGFFIYGEILNAIILGAIALVAAGGIVALRFND